MHRCNVQTDIDLSPGKYYLTYLAVRYYAYPLDIIARAEDPQNDCTIVFLKDHPYDDIPANFEVAAPYDNRSLIAFKKSLRP